MRNGLIVDTDGTQEWYVRDQLHRTDGPAVIHANGSQEWYVNNRLHRTDGPAVIHANGSQEWYVNNRLHRTDGPAVIYASGRQEWYVNGEDITSEVEAWMEKNAITYPFDPSTAALFKLIWL